MNDIVRKKPFPSSYPEDVLDIIDAMSMTNSSAIEILGSMSLRSQQYAGDYDLVERVRGGSFVLRFQHIIQELLKKKDCYIGDIKSGEVPEWKVVPDTLKGYSYIGSVKKLKSLLSCSAINRTEYDEAVKLLIRVPNETEFIVMKRGIKFHVIRWTPSECLKGHKQLGDGRTYTLEEAFQSPSLTKIDVIAFVQRSRFTDFSCIYIFENKAGKVLNAAPQERIEDALKEDIRFYSDIGSYMKVIKRMFSLARIQKNAEELEELNTLLNGDLGRLYSIVSDANTILYLLENEKHIPIEKIRYEINGFRERIANIYTLKTVIRKEPSILEQIMRIERLPSSTAGRKMLQLQMERLTEFFDDIMNKKAKEELTTKH